MVVYMDLLGYGVQVDSGFPKPGILKVIIPGPSKALFLEGPCTKNSVEYALALNLVPIWIPQP